jgi:hypothetical protein
LHCLLALCCLAPATATRGEQSRAGATKPNISCETFDEARGKVAANRGDETVSSYERDNSGTIDGLTHDAFEQHQRDPGEWILRVSKDGIVECVMFSRSTVFSTAIEAALHGAKLTRPPRGPLYLRFFANGVLINPETAKSDQAAEPTRACDWRAGPLYEVATSGLYLYQTRPLDTIWEQLFPVLLPDKNHNYRCLQQLFERGPGIIPGLEAEYVQRVASHSWTSPSLQKTGAEIAAILVFLEPVKGREYVIRKIAEPAWSTRDVAIMADSVWPRRSDAVRRELNVG